MKLYKEFFHYVIPSMLAFALSGVYAVADGFFVGNALGDSALAAVNIAYPLTAFLQAVGTGIGMGGAIQYAISAGTANHKRSRQYFGMSLMMLIISGILLTVLLLLNSPAVLRFFGASGRIGELAREYILYIAFGAIFQVLGTGLVPFIRNMGGAVSSMAAMIAGFLTNIFLDYLFVWQLPFGMMGAAAATVIGQAVTFLVCVVFFIVKKKKPLLRFGKDGAFLFKTILKSGLSPFGLTFSPNITLILINKSAAVFGGAAAVTCYAPVSYISAVIILLLQGVSDGCQPLISLSYGEGRPDRTKQFCSLAYCFAAAVSLLCMGVLFLLRGQAASLFGASYQITARVADILPVFLSGYVFVSISRVTTAYFYATDKDLQACIMIYGEVIILFLLLLILPEMTGIGGTWISVPFSQLAAMCISLFLIRTEKKKESRYRPIQKRQV